MTPRQTRDTLIRLQRSAGLVTTGPVFDGGFAAGISVRAWRAAAAEANLAYEAWRESRDAGSYAVYRAFADRADAAQDALANARHRT
jgi:hypothetical protein